MLVVLALRFWGYRREFRELIEVVLAVDDIAAPRATQQPPAPELLPDTILGKKVLSPKSAQSKGQESQAEIGELHLLGSR